MKVQPYLNLNLAFMNVYHITYEKLPKLSATLFEPFRVEYVSLNSFETVHQEINHSFMKDRYGFSLSNLEINLFKTHIYIWKNFLNTEESNCLVLENVRKVNLNYQHIIESLTEELPSDWDIIFPYDDKKRNILDNEGHYILGYRWGTDAYFLSQKGAGKLLEKSNIIQPVDEVIIEMMLNNELNIYFDDTDFFSYGNQFNYNYERNSMIKEAIYGLKAWSGLEIKKMRKLLMCISSIASENKLELVLSDGSLLGQIRHGGIMPWDDDVDLAINDEQLPKLIEALDKNSEISYNKNLWGGFIQYKIWGVDGEVIKDHDHCFPFIDIWLFKKEGGNIKFNHGLTIYPINIFYPLKQIFFEGAPFFVPNKAKACLDISYSDWKENITVFPWCHKMEKVLFPTLQMEIEVNENGRI